MKTAAMDRLEAESIVSAKVQVYRGCQCIRREDARELLGEERLSRLLADPIRKQGPASTLIYAWNVVDYVQFPDLRKMEPGGTADLPIPAPQTVEAKVEGANG